MKTTISRMAALAAGMAIASVACTRTGVDSGGSPVDSRGLPVMQTNPNGTTASTATAAPSVASATARRSSNGSTMASAVPYGGPGANAGETTTPGVASDPTVGQALANRNDAGGTNYPAASSFHEAPHKTPTTLGSSGGNTSGGSSTGGGH